MLNATLLVFMWSSSVCVMVEFSVFELFIAALAYRPLRVACLKAEADYIDRDIELFLFPLVDRVLCMLLGSCFRATALRALLLF